MYNSAPGRNCSVYCLFNEQMKERNSSQAPQSENWSFLLPLHFLNGALLCLLSASPIIFLSSSPVISKVWDVHQGVSRIIQGWEAWRSRKETLKSCDFVISKLRENKHYWNVIYGLRRTPSLTVGPEMPKGKESFTQEWHPHLDRARCCHCFCFSLHYTLILASPQQIFDE